MYCAAPVFPTEEQNRLWMERVEDWMQLTGEDPAASYSALKADFTLKKIRSFCRLEAVFAVCREHQWSSVDGFYCYWDPQTQSFVQFLSFFSDFPEYHSYLSDYLSLQCQEQLKDVFDPDKLERFLQTDLSFEHFEVGEDGLTVILDESNLLKEGSSAQLLIPQEYMSGGIVDKIANRWKEYAPAQAGEKVIALTFDDGPNNANTNQILDVLEQYQAKATFFVAGHRVGRGTSATLRRIVDLGSQIGNHSFSHADLNRLSVEEMQEEIRRTQEAVYGATGIYPTCLRPPYGNLSPDRVADTGMHAILWNEDTLDWKNRDTQLLIETVLAKASSGDIVLMHDIHKTTADAVEAIVKGLQEQGYRLVTVEELLALRERQPSDLKYFSQYTAR